MECECVDREPHIVFIVLCTVLAIASVWGSFRGIRLSHVLREKLDLHAAMKRQQGDSTEITKMSQEKFLEKGYMVPWEIKYADIKLNEIIGTGSFGQVYKGTWLGTLVAVKVPNSDLSGDLKRRFLEEVNTMSKLHHPNIVIFLGACLRSPNIALVLEFLERGSMHDFLKSDYKIDFALLHKFAVDIARGMKYLHMRCSILQRDLKPRNLLIDQALNVKICDFGLSTKTIIDQDNSLTACGTPYWTAPEIVLGQDYGKKADVYSFAIILWELITREEPFEGKPGMEIAVQVARFKLRPKIPNFCPDSYRGLLEQCWHQEPSKRPDFSQILDRLLEIRKEQRGAKIMKCNAWSDAETTLKEETTRDPSAPAQ